jgi:hypothetical protein
MACRLVNTERRRPWTLGQDNLRCDTTTVAPIWLGPCPIGQVSVTAADGPDGADANAACVAVSSILPGLITG